MSDSYFGLTDLFFDMLKVVVVLFSYTTADQLVEPKGYMPEERYHTSKDRFFIYLKALGACIVASLVINNFIIPYAGLKRNYLEAFALMFIPAIAGINAAYKKKKIFIRKGDSATSKKLLLLIPIIFCCTLGRAQVYKFRAFNTYFSIYDANGNYIRKDDSTTVDFLVVINLTRRKINTYGEKQGNIDLISEASSEKDKFGNTWMQYDGIDEMGEKCIVQIHVLKDQSQDHICTLYVDYPKDKEALVYRLKRDE